MKKTHSNRSINPGIGIGIGIGIDIGRHRRSDILFCLEHILQFPE